MKKMVNNWKIILRKGIGAPLILYEGNDYISPWHIVNLFPTRESLNKFFPHEEGLTINEILTSNRKTYTMRPAQSLARTCLARGSPKSSIWTQQVPQCLCAGRQQQQLFHTSKSLWEKHNW